MSIEEKHNEEKYNRSDVSPLLRTNSNPEIHPRNANFKRNSKNLRLQSLDDGHLGFDNKKICDKNESLPDISAMSVVSLYQKQHVLDDMDTERYVNFSLSIICNYWFN